MEYVEEIASKPVTVTSGDATIAEASQVMAKHNIGSIVVVDEGEIRGILTERDILKKIVAKSMDSAKVKVKEVMNDKVTTIKPGVTIHQAAKMIEEEHIRRLPIVDNGKLVGIITQTDIEKALMEKSLQQLETQVKNLEMFNKIAEKDLKIMELEEKIAELEGRK
ncbi:CBS domain-containing protein [Candidatus Altiarchaeota archaeon]